MTLEQRIAAALRPLGYTKQRTTWHRDHGELISVLNLQKSRWGDDLYLNLAVYLKQLGTETKPPEHRCHVRCRIEALTGHPLPSNPAAAEAVVRDVAVQWLNATNTITGLAAFLTTESARRCAVRREVAEALKLRRDVTD